MDCPLKANIITSFTPMVILFSLGIIAVNIETFLCSYESKA